MILWFQSNPNNYKIIQIINILVILDMLYITMTSIMISINTASGIRLRKTDVLPTYLFHQKFEIKKTKLGQRVVFFRNRTSVKGYLPKVLFSLKFQQWKTDVRQGVFSIGNQKLENGHWCYIFFFIVNQKLENGRQLNMLFSL